VTVELT